MGLQSALVLRPPSFANAGVETDHEVSDVYPHSLRGAMSEVAMYRQVTAITALDGCTWYKSNQQRVFTTASVRALALR